MAHAVVRSRKVYYELHGEHSGIPLVLIMGTGGSCRGWLPIQVPEFSQEHRTLNEVFRVWLESYAAQPGGARGYDEVMARLGHVRAGRKFSREEANERR